MEQLQIHAQKAKDHIKIILALEAATPFTQNRHDFAEKRDKQLAQYKAARPQGPVMLPTKEEMKSALAALTKMGYTVKEEDLAKLNPPDEYQEELELMAEVRAYFYVAYKVSGNRPLLMLWYLFC